MSGGIAERSFFHPCPPSAGLDPERVTPTDSSQFVRPAPRPAYSVLGHDAWAAAGLSPIRDWREALAAAAEQGIFADQ